MLGIGEQKMENQTIHDRIKIARLQLGMTMAELAEKVGYTGRSAIAKVEAGERSISHDMLVKYAEALKVSPLWLLCGDDASINSQEQRLEAYRQELAEVRVALAEARKDADDLKAIAEGYQKQFEDCAEDRSRLTAENERLRRLYNKDVLDVVDYAVDKIRLAKADTVRKMQERLDKRFCHDPAFLGVEQRLIMDIIDEVAKEITDEAGE